jgi:mRNA interferase MazF
MICERWNVVVAAFPFTDLPVAKGRPALVLTPRDFNSGTAHSILAMITSARHSRWASDIEIADLKFAGLRSAAIVRLKLMTLFNARISRRIGSLSEVDREAVARELRASLP